MIFYSVRYISRHVIATSCFCDECISYLPDAKCCNPEHADKWVIRQLKVPAVNQVPNLPPAYIPPHVQPQSPQMPDQARQSQHLASNRKKAKKPKQRCDNSSSTNRFPVSHPTRAQVGDFAAVVLKLGGKKSKDRLHLHGRNCRY